MRMLWEAAVDTVYPRRVLCLACGRPSKGEWLCEQCAAQLKEERIAGDVCGICGYPLENGQCAFCRGRGRTHIRSASRYTGVTRRLVYQLKFNCVEDAAELLAGLAAAEARKLPLPEDTVVTWVAMPRWRMLERGVDHGRILAEKTAKLLELPVRQVMISRKKRGETGQKELNRAGRLQNLRDAFACVDDVPRSVLLVDDVCTTGATGEACAAALAKAGAQNVFVVTAARVVKGTEEKE